MAYKGEKSDRDWDNFWSGLFSAPIFAKAAVWLLIVVCMLIAIKIFIPKEDQVQTVVDITKLSLRHSPYFYSINNTEDAVNITLWEDGLAATSKKAYDGDKEAILEWEKTKLNIFDYIKDIYAQFIAKDIEAEVTVKVVNENNKDRTLLFIKGGSIVYDIVAKEGE